MKPLTACPAAIELQSFVECQVGADEGPALAEHLEHCPNCQQRLLDLAADNDTWQQTRQHLRPDDAARAASGWSPS